MSLTEKIKKFNPDENGLRESGIFGLPFDVDEAQIVLIPVPWEATVSYREGAAKGPEAILKASHQIDLYSEMNPGGWKAGFAMDKIPQHIIDANAVSRARTSLYLNDYSNPDGASPQVKEILSDINNMSQQLCDYVKDKTISFLDHGKFVGVVGGEHSVPLGFMQALAERHEYGILQVDAHADLRNAYEGLTHSHASIMFNAMKVENITKLVQVGIRDFSEGENEEVKTSNGRIVMHTDSEIKKSIYGGSNWNQICDTIISELPQNVYISFDIDGLQPWLCPNTGTPVAGGLQFEEAVYLIEKLALSGKKIIGFDLCEVAPGYDEWDGNVGSRILYALCNAAAKNNDFQSN
jgi:agmatinase